MWGWFGAAAPAEGGEQAGKNSIPQPSKEDYKALHDKTLDVLIGHAATTEGWNLIKDENEMQLYDKAVDSTAAIHLVKATGVVKASAKTCYETVLDTSMESRKKWDQDLAFYDVKEQIGDNIIITHVGFTAPMGVTSRDFCAIRCHTEIEGTYYIWGCSVVHSSVPEDTTGYYVRGIILVSGFAIKPIDDTQCLVSNITQVDPAGWIPAWLVNLSKGKALTRLQNFKNLVEP